MEKDCESYPQDTVDAAPRDTAPRGGFEKFKKFESSRGCQSEQEGERAGTSKHLEPLELDKLEERFRKECRKSCRRNLLVELLKTVAKVAGVILAAMGWSAFGEED